jgi:hypothetical protein
MDKQTNSGTQVTLSLSKSATQCERKVMMMCVRAATGRVCISDRCPSVKLVPPRLLVVVRKHMNQRDATWLILPVVICLSQRLSHACLSTSLIKVKPRMAH